MAKEADEKLNKAKEEAAATSKKLAADTQARELGEKKKEIEKQEKSLIDSIKKRK